MIIEIAYIYKLTNKLSGKVYIGQTVQDPERRWGSTDSLRGYRETSAIGKAIRSVGWDNFTREVIETLNNVTQNEINAKEAYYIALYDSLNSDKGYNLKSYMEGGKEFFTDDVKARMSATKTGVALDRPAWNATEFTVINDVKHWRCSKCESYKPEASFSKNYRKKVDGSDRTRPVVHWCKACAAEYKRNKFKYKGLSKEELAKSYETRKQAMSEGLKKAYANNPEMKAKASKARSKAIVAKDPITGQIVHRFESGLAAKQAGFNNVTISEAIKKGLVRLGYKWELDVL